VATPVVENIGAFLESAINDITVENGFNYDLTATRSKRFFLEDETLDDLKVYILQGKSDSKGDVLSEISPRIVRQEYLIWAICLQSDTAEEVIDTKINKVKSDIQKKLCEDPYCGGYAKMLDVLSCEPTDTPETGILITVEVLYSVQWNNSYIQK